ncbi:MAG: ROK family protein [Balneolaceae bacterium]
MKKRNLIGIDLGATNVRVARVLNQEIESISSQPIIQNEDHTKLLKQIISLIEKEITPEVSAIGVGVPSVVDVEKGIVYDVQNIPSWKMVPLKDILEERFNVPVYINNDANCFALGEKYFGKAQNYNSVVGLIIGTGFGSGLIMNGKLFSGANCGAGEVGMLPYKDSIFEHYCSGQFFEIHKNTDGLTAYSKALEGDKEALEMYKEFGTHVGNGIKAVMYAFDPEIIVLGGSASKALALFEPQMREAMSDFAYTQSLEKVKISVSELDQVAILGAAALALDQQIPTK